MGLCIEAGLQSSRRGGWNTLSPVLRYGTVVSRELPVFKLLIEAGNAACSIDSASKTRPKELEVIFSSNLIALLRAFCDSIRPTDVDERGNN